MHLASIPVWQDIRLNLRRAVGDETFQIWLAALEVRDWDGAVLTLTAPEATRAWVSGRFSRVIERAAREALGPAVRVSLTAGGAEAAPSRRYDRHRPPNHDPQPETDLRRLIPRYTFDQFIIGDSNRLAHAAALAVAEAPGHAYSPLFLHAPPGLGKTHLLHAIGNYIATFDPQTTVAYTTVEAFTNGFLSALNSKAMSRFKDLYRGVDVLLIDDVQFLASKARTEEEFFHTFNTLYDSGRQLVLTCDRLPAQLLGIADRLRARFEAGLVASLAAPDRSTRIAILRKRAELDGILNLDPDVIELIADRVRGNVRSLEGALVRVIAHQSLTGRPLDARLAQAALDEIAPADSSRRSVSPNGVAIIRQVAEYFGLSAAELTSASRAARVSWPRQLAIHLARELTTDSTTTIGEQFGGRNHATVIHASKRVEQRVRDSRQDAAELQALREILTTGSDDRVA